LPHNQPLGFAPYSGTMKVALLCSGLGHIARGHEVFARGLFDLLRDDIDMTLLKGGGDASKREWVVPHVPRNAPVLDAIHVAASPKWAASMREQERMRVEGETFGYGALGPLLEGDFDVIHCLEQEVCNIVHANRHVFGRTPHILFSNGGAIAAADLPDCDFVQEHSDYNLARSARHKAFMIPHGVDLQRFRPNLPTDFRARHGIPHDAFVVISVGTVCYHHKRMDHVIREVAGVKDAYLVICGQDSQDSPAIKALGHELMAGRIQFMTLPHEELPQAYAGADVFVLGSLFETFGIAYIEALATGLPVICTDHPNQRAIVKEGVFIDMKRPGRLGSALQPAARSGWPALGRRGRQVAEQFYDLRVLKQQYVDRYRSITKAAAAVPTYTLRSRIIANAGAVWRKVARARRSAALAAKRMPWA